MLLQRLPEPLYLPIEIRVRCVAFLVQPVRGDSVLGKLVHLRGPDLNLHRQGVLAQHGGVQGLVEIVLGVGHVVVELAGQWPPLGVDHAEGSVAVTYFFDLDAQSEQVEYLAVGAVLGGVTLHLVVNTVDVLRSPGHLGLDPDALQLTAKRRNDPLDVGLPLHSLGAQQLRYFLIALRVDVLEGEVLQSPLDLPDPQAVG